VRFRQNSIALRAASSQHNLCALIEIWEIPLSTAADNRTSMVTVLEANRAERNYWRDLWAYRELFMILGWRDVAVQYKQSVIGIAWAVVRPLLTMAIFTVVFGRLAGLPSAGSVPYPLMVMAGMLPWFLISSILTQGSGSLVMNSNLISKVYFPRLIVPVASAVVASGNAGAVLRDDGAVSLSARLESSAAAIVRCVCARRRVGPRVVSGCAQR
jgi:hypothetical protein